MTKIVVFRKGGPDMPDTVSATCCVDSCGSNQYPDRDYSIEIVLPRVSRACARKPDQPDVYANAR